jgi:signal transduction histidine kinase
MNVKFSTKLFIAIIVPGLMGIAGLSILLCRSFASKTMESFDSRYLTITKTLGTTLFELEMKSEALMTASLATLDARMGSGPPPSNSELSELAAQLGMSHFYITDGKGQFIRSTKEDPATLPNIFSFCPTYQSTFQNRGEFIPTGIMPGFPSGLPHKFLLRASQKNRYILEAGIHADYIGRTIQETAKADPNIVAIKLIAPAGQTLVEYGAADNPSQAAKVASRMSPIIYDDAEITYTQYIPASNKLCCSCKKRGLADGDYGYFLSISVSRSPLQQAIIQLQSFSAVAALIIGTLCFLIAKLISTRLSRRIKLMNEVITDVTESKAIRSRLNLEGNDEVSRLARRFDRMLDTLQEKESELTELTKKEATLKVASQLAHDIRSPLTALSVIIAKSGAAPEESRVLIRSAISRIQDVANRLLQTSQSLRDPGSTHDEGVDTLEPTLISAIVESLVSEKRIQYSNRHEIVIETTQDQNSYCLFAYVDRAQLLRVLSNLIDNSIEAIQGDGRITVMIDEHAGSARIRITDNGPGFPVELAGRIGERGATFGKAGGNGLGLHSAKCTIERWGGVFSVESLPGLGANVSIQLERAPAPPWLLPRIQIQCESTVMVLDDDPSIHATWDQLLAQAGRIGSRISHFTDTLKAETWLKSRGHTDSLLCLIDYELLRDKMNGLDFIDRNAIANCAVLVTSHQDDAEILERCKELGVPLLPKSLVPLVPIALNMPFESSVMVDANPFSSEQMTNPRL